MSETGPRFPDIELKLNRYDTDWEIMKKVHIELQKHGLDYATRREFLKEAIEIGIDDRDEMVYVATRWVTLK